MDRSGNLPSESHSIPDVGFDCVYVCAVRFGCPLEKTAALITHSARIALVEVNVFPIRNRLLSKLPKTPIQDAKLVVVDGDIHAT